MRYGKRFGAVPRISRENYNQIRRIRRSIIRMSLLQSRNTALYFKLHK